MEDMDKKSQLENEIVRLSNSIEFQLKEYKTQGKNILIIGGIIVASYSLAQLLSSDDEEEERPSKINKSSAFSSAITGVAASLLLNLAKNKLLEIIENFNAEKQ
jgi:hypothetical protein